MRFSTDETLKIVRKLEIVLKEALDLADVEIVIDVTAEQLIHDDRGDQHNESFTEGAEEGTPNLQTG